MSRSPSTQLVRLELSWLLVEPKRCALGGGGGVSTFDPRGCREILFRPSEGWPSCGAGQFKLEQASRPCTTIWGPPTTVVNTSAARLFGHVDCLIKRCHAVVVGVSSWGSPNGGSSEGRTFPLAGGIFGAARAPRRHPAALIGFRASEPPGSR